jgi:hypothetical protein
MIKQTFLNTFKKNNKRNECNTIPYEIHCNKISTMKLTSRNFSALSVSLRIRIIIDNSRYVPIENLHQTLGPDMI